MKKRPWIVLFGLFLALLVLTACGSKAITVNVQMQEYKFTPDRVEVPAGAEVTLKLSNKGTLEHEFVIMMLNTQATTPFDADDEPNVYWEHELQPGQEESITFTAPSEPGEYQIVCGIPAHMEQGMKGALIVK